MIVGHVGPVRARVTCPPRAWSVLEKCDSIWARVKAVTSGGAEADDHLVLEEAFGGYIKTVVLRPIPDAAVRVAALQNGEVDVAVNMPPHLAAIIAGHTRVFLSTAPSIPTLQLMFVTQEFEAQHKLVALYGASKRLNWRARSDR